MKKRATSILLVLAMVFSLVLIAAPTAQAAGHTDHCVCGGKAVGLGDHTCANATWTELTSTVAESPLATGNYYLAADLNLTAPIKFGYKAKVSICLNGFALKGNHEAQGNDGRVFYMTQENSVVNICDCSKDNTGTITSNANATGSVCYMEMDDAVLNIFGGTLTGGTNTGSKAGATIRQATNLINVTINLYGGHIKDGNSGSYGGNIAVYSFMNMYGGTISGGNGTVRGGNLYLGQNADVKIYGGAIINGTCPENSDIWVQDGKLTIYNLDESTKLYHTAAATINMENMSQSLSKPADAVAEKTYTLTKDKTYVDPTPAPAPETGDAANLTVMGLGMVIGLAGMACLLPKKRKQ